MDKDLKEVIRKAQVASDSMANLSNPITSKIGLGSKF
jgi:hypothetical protein